MKGIVLAGGRARRLGELTEVTNKHLLPVYHQPMIYYPLQTLVRGGVDDILIVSSRDHSGAFLRLLGSGERFSCRLTYRVQDESGGIAQALSLAEDFVHGEKCAVILGDNIFEDDFSSVFSEFEKSTENLTHKSQNAPTAARIFLKNIPDAARFGVAELDGADNRGERVLNIEEKPARPKSSYAVTGLYLYDENVFNIIRGLTPSGRGEYEITDVNNAYIQSGGLKATVLEGNWTDAGTFESLFRANLIGRKIALQKSFEERSNSLEEMELLTKILEGV